MVAKKAADKMRRSKTKKILEIPELMLFHPHVTGLNEDDDDA